MGFILNQSWEDNAHTTAQMRGEALPRHAIPSDRPSYDSAVMPGECIKGSIILPVVHFKGLDSQGAETNENYTQYGQVIVSSESFQKLSDAGIVDENTAIYYNFHDCVEEIRRLNTEFHEDYLTKYKQGALSHVAEWHQSAGDTQRVKDLCAPQNQCSTPPQPFSPR